MDLEMPQQTSGLFHFLKKQLKVAYTLLMLPNVQAEVLRWVIMKRVLF